ncbi:MAG: PASTA domain-containing protein [bacterium]|nr:PASTA domain-containing protein [Candidatus Sumerlaeota bacterium]
MRERNKRIFNPPRRAASDQPVAEPSSPGGAGEDASPNTQETAKPQAGTDTTHSFQAGSDADARKGAQGGNEREIPASATQKTAAAMRAGDTIRMQSVERGPTQPPEKTLSRMAAIKARRSGRATGGVTRVEEMPRHEMRGRPRWGLFSFVTGFIGLIVRVIVIAGIIMALAAWMGFEAMKMYINTPQVTVPNVRGMKIADAVEVLSKAGFSLIKERSELSGLVAPGEIIEQRPQPGSSAKNGTTVRIIISSGRANFIVPDVVGETKDNAVNKIKGAQLDVGNLTYIESDKIPKDSVISQNPEANKGLEQGVKVDLLISSGIKAN